MGLGSGIRDPRSGIRKKPIPDPGSRGQKGTGSRIPDPDPQHWILEYAVFINRAVDPDPIRIRGFDDQNLKKKIQQQISFLFFYHKLQFTFVQATGEAFTPQKRTSSTSKNEIY
jgi:hypothetical protein